MSKTIQEQIEVMQHFANGGEVEYKKKKSVYWRIDNDPSWNWIVGDYRIKDKKEKTTLTIKQWLIELDGRYIINEGNDSELHRMVNSFNWKKIKLLDSYEVEL